jgi:hypothetical protein
VSEPTGCRRIHDVRIHALQLGRKRKLVRAELPHSLAIGRGMPAACVVAAAVHTAFEYRQVLVVSIL